MRCRAIVGSSDMDLNTSFYNAFGRHADASAFASVTVNVDLSFECRDHKFVWPQYRIAHLHVAPHPFTAARAAAALPIFIPAKSCLVTSRLSRNHV